MTKKAQEIELRTIMQGLEEFATFMSYRGNSSGLRILSVETVQQYQAQQEQAKADVIPIKKAQPSKRHQSLKRALAFQDRMTH